MFTLDLLKGQGVPAKSRPEGIIFAAASFTVPVLAAIVMFGCYVANGIDISIQKQQMAGYQTKINELSDALELQKSFEKEKGIIRGCRSETANSIGRYAQWTAILATLAKSVPDSMVLTKFDVKQNFIKKKSDQKTDGDNSKETTDATVPVRILQMSVSGKSQANSDEAVRDFRVRLRSSAPLGPKLEDIRVLQKSDVLEGQDVVSYDIDCVFKPGL